MGRHDEVARAAHGMRGRTRIRLLAAIGLPALAWAYGAAAQTPSDNSVSEIVVTAEKTETTLQRSSVAIQVVSGHEIERSGVTKATDLNRLVPGLQIGTGGNAAQIYIRGVGDFAASALSNPAVAVNVDGVYIARPQGVNANFYDLARVEVLKGPQGTLYGRNASGGAINLVTTRPVLGDIRGYILGELGNYANKRLEGAINVPLGETVAARASFLLADRNGYLSDGTDDESEQAARLRVLWEPNADVSLLINGDYAHEGGKGPGYVMLPRPAGTDKWTSASSPQANAVLTSTPPLGFLIPPVGTDTYVDNNQWNLSAELNWNLGPATLTLLPAYRDLDAHERNYPAGLRNTWSTKSHQSSLEARLSNTTDHLRWVAGAYYFREAQTAAQDIYQGILNDVSANYKPTTTSYAAFGQATFSVTDQFRLIGGLRYTYESKTLTGARYTNSPNGLPPGTPLPLLLDNFGGKTHFTSTNWKAGAEFDVSPTSMLYFTASTGFKAGGFNQSVAPLDTYDPEKITAYELGMRNRFLGGRVQLNLEAFKWDYKGAQIAHVIFDPKGNLNLITQNAGQASIKGFDIDARIRVGEGGRLHGLVEYNDAVYDRFRYASGYSIFGSPLFNPASVGCPVGAPYPGANFGTVLIDVNCDGFQMPRAPKWSGLVSYDHTLRLNDGSQINAAATLQFASARWLGFEYVPTERAKAYQMLDLDLTYTAPKGAWSVSGYVHNVTNAALYSGAGEQGFVPPLVYATIAPPRTYGVKLRYNIQ